MSERESEGDMFRRAASYFLVPCLLLSQSAALGHCQEHFGRQAPPHIHLHELVGTADHHDDGDEHPPHEQVPCHDDDAVYLAGELLAVRHAQTHLDSDIDSALSWTANAVCSYGLEFLAQRELRLTHSPPTALAATCPLFLRHLALLI